MANQTNYQITCIPEFPAILKTGTIDCKNRGYVPVDILEVIVGRNKFYLSNLVYGGSQFSYKHPNIYLDEELIVRLDAAEDEKEIPQENLVQILTDPPTTLDIENINSKLYAVPTKIRGVDVLVARPFFDWKLYERGIKSLPEEKLYQFILCKGYTEMEDKKGILLTQFLEKINISSDTGIGFKGFGGAVIMGNPKYLEPRIGFIERVKAALRILRG